MDGYVIIGRMNVASKAKEMIERLRSDIYSMIRPYKHEVMFNIVFLFPNLFATLARKREEEHRLYFDITWVRAVTAITTALNHILPDFIPLKPPARLKPSKLEESFNILPQVTSKLFDLAWWLFILENKYIDKIIVHGLSPDVYWSEEYREAISKYVSNLLGSEDYLDWLDWFYPRLGKHKEFVNALDNYLLSKYGFNLNDLAGASEYLMQLYKKFKEEKQPPIVYKNKLHEVFSKNIRSTRSSKLLNALIFCKGKDLMKSPLIPLEGGDLLIAGWIFELHQHFDAWIKLILEEEPRLWSMYANIAGREFENYVSNKISKVVHKMFENVVISEKEFPSIKDCLEKLRKKGSFEIDIVAIINDKLYVISCKGGKKEIPKIYKSKYWVYPSEKEIIDRLKENIEEVNELIEEAKCLRGHREVVKQLFSMEVKDIVPVIVYAFPQPLAIEDFRAKISFTEDVIVSTPNQLLQLMTST